MKHVGVYADMTCTLFLRRSRAVRDRSHGDQSTDPMKRRSLQLRRTWMLVAIAVFLVAGHGIILYYFSSHLALSAAVASGVIVVVVIKHVGLLGSLYGRLRRRFRP